MNLLSHSRSKRKNNRQQKVEEGIHKDIEDKIKWKSKSNTLEFCFDKIRT
jgi:hypothetical protein